MSEYRSLLYGNKSYYALTKFLTLYYWYQELNIGGSLVTAALEEACGTNRLKIREMFNKFGDLGWVIVFIVFDCFTKPVQSVRILNNWNNMWLLKGDVAQECRQTHKSVVKHRLLATPTPLLIKDVFSALQKIRY